MTQLTQHDKNPFAEGAAARVSRTGATPSISTDAFTGWPQQGTKSHKVVATGTATATVGLPNTDRPAAAAGEQWSATATIRNSAAGSRTLALLLVFYDTLGATLGTALATTTASATFTAGESKTLKIAGATAPVGTAAADVQVTRAAGGGATTSDALHFEKVTFTKTPIAIESKDPALDPFAVWTSTADASTQTYYTPVVTATPLLDENPAPRVQLLIDDLPPGVSTITLTRTSQGRTFKVRGGVSLDVAGGGQAVDVEANGTVSYRAEMFDNGEAPLGFTAEVEATLNVTDTWVHNPLDPQSSVKIDLDDTSARDLLRSVDGEVFYPEGRTLGVMITGRRRGLEDVPMFFSSDQPDVAERFEALFGGYNDDDQQIPIICVRTIAGYTDLPPTFYAGFLKLPKRPINIHMGGDLREWEGSASEVAPPAAALVVALLSRNDLDYFYGTRSALDAAYASRLAADRDYSKAGIAP